MEAVSQKPKKKLTKIEQMTKEEIRQAILKKRQCSARAQQIVVSLLEASVTETYLLQCLPDINQSHFEDIIEERVIIGLCGYPVCQSAVSMKDTPKQRFRISLKSNKVYDITARKSFCSNACYNSAMHVKKQMLTSPLWFREYEKIPTFHLLKQDAVGTMGEEVDLTLSDRVTIPEKKSFTSINDFAEASLNDISPNSQDKTGNSDKSSNRKSEPQESGTNKSDTDIANVSINEKLAKIDLKSDVKNSGKPEVTTDTKHEIKDSKLKVSEQGINKSVSPSTSTVEKDVAAKKSTKPTSNPLNIVGDIIEKPEKKIDPILMTPVSTAVDKESKSNKKLPQKKLPLLTALTIEVEQSLAEWFTLNTVLLLFGEEKVREMVANKGVLIEEYLKNFIEGTFYSSDIHDQYQELCKKLNMLQIEDKLEMVPLPNYTMLQEESKKMELKVKAFYSGETEITEPVAEEPMQVSEFVEDEMQTNLPLVDKTSQNALRRRIVCQHLNNIMPDILRSLGLVNFSITSDIRLLVSTFKLKANNITFKPLQWALIAIVFVKLLSLRDKRLEHLLEQELAYKHMQLLLLSYKQDEKYLDRLISWLTDVDRLLDTTETQLTVE